VPGHGAALRSRRGELIRRLRADGHEAPLDGEGWRVFPRRELPDGPDGGLLFQEGGSVEQLFPPGYRPRCNP